MVTGLLIPELVYAIIFLFLLREEVPDLLLFSHEAHLFETLLGLLFLGLLEWRHCVGTSLHL